MAASRDPDRQRVVDFLKDGGFPGARTAEPDVEPEPEDVTLFRSLAKAIREKRFHDAARYQTALRRHGWSILRLNGGGAR